MIGYAFTLGLLAAVNPCGFPLLPAYLASFVTAPERTPVVVRLARGLLAGACLTAGFLVVFIVAGLLVQLGGGLALAWTPWVMVGVGAALCVYGVAALIGHAPSFSLPTPGSRPGRGLTTMTAYGMTYAVGSLTCSLPLFLASVTERFTHLGAWAGLGTVIAYGLGMGFFVTGAGVVASLVGAGAARRLRPISRVVPFVGAAVLILTGAYLIVYWIADILAPESTVGIVAAVAGLQESISGWLGTYPLRVGIIAGAVVLASFVAVTVAEARASRRLRSTPPLPTPRRPAATPLGRNPRAHD